MSGTSDAPANTHVPPSPLSPLLHRMDGTKINSTGMLGQIQTMVDSDFSPVASSGQQSPKNFKSHISRGRGLSRSFSLPSMMQHPSRDNHESISPIFTGAGVDGSGTRHSNSSVKHLTCFWWREKGSCRFSDEDCLYAHYDTGHYTDPPRQLIPGEPALAGRKLDRAMRNLAITANRSTASLSSAAGSRHPSRPSTPIVGGEAGTASTFNFSSPLSSPLAIQPQLSYSTDYDLARLNNDNHFLRTLVDQNSKEKAIMISTIESLQADNKGFKGEVEGLRTAQEQLLVERDGLRKRIKQLEDGQPCHNLNPARNTSNPFGAIGRGRVNTETRYLGALLTEE